MLPLVGGIGVLLAAGVTAFFIMSQPDANTVKADTTAAPVPAAVNAAATGAPEPPAQQATGTQTSNSTQTPTPLSKPLGRNTAPTGGATAQPPNTTVDFAVRIPELLREAAENATAAKALREATQLQARAIASSDVIGLSLVRATAHAQLGQDKQSCDIIEVIKERGASTVYAERLSHFVSLCAQ